MKAYSLAIAQAADSGEPETPVSYQSSEEESNTSNSQAVLDDSNEDQLANLMTKAMGKSMPFAGKGLGLS